MQLIDWNAADVFRYVIGYGIIVYAAATRTDTPNTDQPAKKRLKLLTEHLEEAFLWEIPLGETQSQSVTSGGRVKARTLVKLLYVCGASFFTAVECGRYFAAVPQI